MKRLKDYILEAENSEQIEQHETNDKNSEGQDEELNHRGEIKFTIWKEPDKKVTWLKDNEQYQKIEYKHEDKKKNIFIDFLLGFDKEESTWKLWVGKIGAVNYDDDPYCDFETESFATAIVKALDKVEEFIKNVEDEPENWIQYYKNI